MNKAVLKSRDIKSLRHAVARGGKAKYVFFWNDKPAKDGSITPSCFSQWYSAPFSIDGHFFPTAEHYMMAEKARLFGDDEAFQRILKTRQPGAAKSIGREVRGFNNEKWVQHRFDIVVAGNVAKFEQNPALGEFLLSTSRRVLVEASPVDRIWGIGFESSAPQATNPLLWRGLNLMGFGLMEVRARLVLDKQAR